MAPGSALVDVGIDQGGIAETSRPTSHSAPTYVEEGVNHYCVPNMPGAVAHTSTFALTNTTMKYALAIADKGVVAKDWRTQFPHGAAPTTSTMLFLVRKGNPKGIMDWDDLL